MPAVVDYPHVVVPILLDHVVCHADATAGMVMYFGFRPCRASDASTCTCLIALLVASSVYGLGCEVAFLGRAPDGAVEIARGKDSAGAIIELLKQGDGVIRARVTDLVLGTGEAEVTSGDEGAVEFLIRFPLGVAISYVGVIRDAAAPGVFVIEGTWQQHAEGLFGADGGEWTIPLGSIDLTG